VLNTSFDLRDAPGGPEVGPFNLRRGERERERERGWGVGGGRENSRDASGIGDPLEKLC